MLCMHLVCMNVYTYVQVGKAVGLPAVKPGQDHQVWELRQLSVSWCSGLGGEGRGSPADTCCGGHDRITCAGVNMLAVLSWHRVCSAGRIQVRAWW